MAKLLAKKIKNSTKLVQKNWEEPKLDDWLRELKKAIQKIDSPTILVAHSLAVSLVMHWTSANNNPHIIGALLVAPADVDSPEHTPDVTRNFSPMPIRKLPFPSIVVCSENDPFIDIKKQIILPKMGKRAYKYWTKRTCKFQFKLRILGRRTIDFTAIN